MQTRSSMAVRSLAMILTGVAFIVVVLFGFSDPVGAKGPESVTITGPGIDQPIELMDTDNFELVARLMEQTGLWYGSEDPIEEPSGELGPSYTLTWINSGPPGKSQDERTIRQEIYLDAEYGPLIHTPDQEALQGWGSGVIGWFVAPSGLRDTLIELDVPVSAASSSSEAALSETDADTAPSEREPGTPWYLGVVIFALVVGLAEALGAHLTRFRKRNTV